MRGIGVIRETGLSHLTYVHVRTKEVQELMHSPNRRCQLSPNRRCPPNRRERSRIDDLGGRIDQAVRQIDEVGRRINELLSQIDEVGSRIDDVLEEMDSPNRRSFDFFSYLSAWRRREPRLCLFGVAE